MYLKKGAAFVLAALLALSLCACGGDVEGTEQEQATVHPLTNFTPEQVCDLFSQKVLEDDMYSDVLGLSFGEVSEADAGTYQLPMTLTKTKTAREGRLVLYADESGNIEKAEISGAVDYTVLVRELFYSLDLPAAFAEDINGSWAADIGESQEWERDGVRVHYESNADGSNHILSVCRA